MDKNNKQSEPHCLHAENPKGCYRVRCQLGNKCVDDALSSRTSAGQDGQWDEPNPPTAFDLARDANLNGATSGVGMQQSEPSAAQDGQRADWSVMMSAHSLCPTEMSHPDRMRWMADYFRKNSAQVQPTKLTDEQRGVIKRAREELRACKSAIHLAGGFDPAYVKGAEASMVELNAILATRGGTESAKEGA